MTLPAVVQRILERTEIVDLGYVTPCWVWTGSLTCGYGDMSVERKVRKVHRVAYEELVGLLPPGHEMDHLCHTEAVRLGRCAGGHACLHRACWCPDHLEPVTRRENVLRGASPIAQFIDRDHCDQGHAYTEANTYINATGRRTCKVCRRRVDKARRVRDRAKRLGLA